MPVEAATTPTRKSVLFVDDEPKVLQALERMLRPWRHEWRIVLVPGGQQALEALEREEFDVLVSDMRMPGMNGVQLMEHVVERYPRMVRIGLSGHAERDVVIRAVRLVHQYLSKPCDGDLLKDTLDQALRLRRFTECPRLQAIAAGVGSLRSVPTLYAQIVAELQMPAPSVARVADVVAADPAMTARVLQMINSAFFGMRGYVSDAARAVQLLGLDTVKALVLSVQVYAQFEREGLASPADLWRHSMRTARLAERIAGSLGLDSRGMHEAFTAGLLHDVGKLVMAEALPGYNVIVAEAPPQRDLADVERHEFGASHAEVGAYLFGLWGLPYGIVEAVAWHHRPAESGVAEPCPLTCVHAANVIDRQLAGAAQATVAMDDNYLASLGLAEASRGWYHLAPASAGDGPAAA